MDRDLDALTQFQWGLVKWLQLLEFMSEKQARRDIDDGRLIRILKGVYRMAGVCEVRRHLPMAAFLAIDEGAAGGCCAGWLRGMPSVPGRKTELVVPYAKTPHLPNVIIRRSTYLPPHHIEHLDALAVTTAARSICDMSARLSTATIARILRGAVRLDFTTYDKVGRARDDMRARGRRRMTVIDEVLEGRVPGGTPGDSEGEYKLLDWISKAGLPIPKQQVWVPTAGGRYCLDLAYPEEKIDLEWDSDLHEKTPDDVEYDAARDIELELAGWLVMRQSKLTRRHDFVRRLETALQRRARDL
ncbi:MAG: hypothetical protein H0W70_10435 [Actinobacteria bacterium]|nr:hypothetical protein [Actinomycetota bacterium]